MSGELFSVFYADYCIKHVFQPFGLFRDLRSKFFVFVNILSHVVELRLVIVSCLNLLVLHDFVRIGAR